MTPTTGISKAALEAIAIAKGLGGEFVQNMLDAGKTLTEINTLPAFQAAPAKPKPVEPIMPEAKQGEAPAEFMKRLQAYAKSLQEYVTALKAFNSRKREFGVFVNLTKGIFNITIPDGSFWCGQDGMDAVLDNLDVLSDIASGKVEVECKRDGVEGKTKQKVTPELMAKARETYRQSPEGKAASAGRRETFKAHATAGK